MNELIEKFIAQNETVAKMAKELCAYTGPGIGLGPLIKYVAELTSLFAGVLGAYATTFNTVPTERERFVVEYLEGVKKEVLKSPTSGMN